MNNPYLYGAYGRKGDTILKSAAQSGTVVAYVGTAPVNLVRGYTESGMVNTPVKIASVNEARQKLGQSADWPAFTLCEAMAAHFDNAVGNIGPVYLINVLDPDKHKEAAPVEEDLVFVSGRCEIQSDRIILDTFALEDKVEGTDYTLDYDFDRGVLVVGSVQTASPLDGIVAASYSVVDPTAVQLADIVGSATEEGVYTGVGATALLYPLYNVILGLLAVPGWSEQPEVYRAMQKAVQDINGHWDGYTLADLPVDGVGTIPEAIKWKTDNAYTSELGKVFWPQAIDAGGRVFHLSTLAAVEFQRIDATHEGIPMETCANKEVPVIGQYFGAGSGNGGFDQNTGNTLAACGISTVVPWGGKWKLWGDHTAAYSFEAEMDARAIFDVSIRMLHYLTNAFQTKWAPVIDEPMSRQMVERVINEEQENLDRLVSLGALLGTPTVQFITAENSTEQMMEGNFHWNLEATPTPPFKSATAVVSYSAEGFSSLYGEDE